MMSWPILSLITALPLAGVVLILLVQEQAENARRNVINVALFSTLCTFLLSLFLFSSFDRTVTTFQFVEKVTWLESGISWHMGVDGISLPFVLLTTFLAPLCILFSSVSLQERVKEYMIAFLLLETLMIGVFCALDLLLFYIFFEACLIPMFIIIGVWGGPGRVYAAFKFFLYTFLGSLLMLFAILFIFHNTGTSDIPVLLKETFPVWTQIGLWSAFFASFAVKTPMWPLHTWLLDAHTEAPTAGSVVLAGILLKAGGYGFLRFSLPMFPWASDFFAPFIFFLSLIAIIYASLAAFIQQDIKKLIAYSSVAHMGYVTLGIFSMNEEGIQGAVFQMISHGLVSSGLFLCAGMLHDRMHTREIEAYGGLALVMPKCAVAFLILTMSNIGLPGLSGFVGEFLSLLGAAKVMFWVSVLGATGLVFSAAYGLRLYQRLFMGTLKKNELSVMKDLSVQEKATLYPLIGLVLFLGLYPALILDTSAVSVKTLVKRLSIPENFSAFNRMPPEKEKARSVDQQ